MRKRLLPRLLGLGMGARDYVQLVMTAAFLRLVPSQSAYGWLR